MLHYLVACARVRESGLNLANLLLIDDEEDLVDLIRFDLQRRGHTVEVCTDGAAAIDLLGRRGFDLVITDLRMPGSDGLAICQTMRQKHGSTPVIVLSGYSEVDLELDTLGITHRLRKPFPLASLATLIDELTKPTN